MSDHHEALDLTKHAEPNEGESQDVVAALAIITLVILAAIHFVYTDGLLGFIADRF